MAIPLVFESRTKGYVRTYNIALLYILNNRLLIQQKDSLIVVCVKTRFDVMLRVNIFLIWFQSMGLLTDAWTRCGEMIPHDDIDLGQHKLSWWRLKSRLHSGYSTLEH